MNESPSRRPPSRPWVWGVVGVGTAALTSWMLLDGRAGVSLRPGATFTDCPACPEMVVIGPGSFRMGSPPSEPGRWDDEGPQRRVTIPEAFALGVHEVTFDDWNACELRAGCGGYAPDDEGLGKGRFPIINVSWQDAEAYASWLSRETGKAYRLPTETEWEYAARAGTVTSRHWGNGSAGRCRYANGAEGAPAPGANADGPNTSCNDGHLGPAPVGSYSPNAWGLYDMLGNAAEWTADCWQESYEGAPADGSAWPGGDCPARVVRGGSWISFAGALRSAFRDWEPAGNRHSDIGFRVARAINH